MSHPELRFLARHLDWNSESLSLPQREVYAAFSDWAGPSCRNAISFSLFTKKLPGVTLLRSSGVTTCAINTHELRAHIEGSGIVLPSLAWQSECTACGERFRCAADLAVHRMREHSPGLELRKRKETTVVAAVAEAVPGAVWDREVFVGWGGCGRDAFRAYVDVCGQGTFGGQTLGAVLLEVDEGQHSRYACDCERMVNVTGALRASGNTQPILWVRFNPDRFALDGQVARCRASDRLRRLVEMLEGVTFEAQVAVVYLFYSSRTLEAAEAKRMGCPRLAGSLVPECLLREDVATNIVRNVWFITA